MTIKEKVNEYQALVCITSNYHRINIKDNGIMNNNGMMGGQIFFLSLVSLRLSVDTRITISEK